MLTNTPIITTECISTTLPSIKGNCNPGIINVYNEYFEIVKTINVNTSFYINLEDVPSNAYVLTNKEVNKDESLYSKIIIKCCNVLDEYNCLEVKKCNKC